MIHTLALGGLPAGGQAVVVAVHCPDAMRQRLCDLGMTGGTRVTCLHRTRGGRLAAYGIRGAVIALRQSDTEKVLIKLPEAGV